MIKPNELRLGNWLFVGNTTMKQIDVSDLEILVDSSTFYSSIPLTCEILKACGFEEKVNKYS